MAITLETDTRNAACDAIVGLVDDGAGAGTLELKSADSPVAGTNEVATLTFSDPAFGNAAAGVATNNTITDDSNAAGGTAATFTIFDSDSNSIFRGSVTATGGGGDIEISSVAIGASDTVEVSSLTVTMPAS